MPSPSHIKKSFTAQRRFTDRASVKDVFETALNKDQGEEDYRILFFYGVGGEGKTALCQELQRMLEVEKKSEKSLGWTSIDIKNSAHKDPVQGLLAFRMGLKKTISLSLPRFDIAFCRYFAMTTPGVDIKVRHPELFKFENEIVNDLLETAGEAANACLNISTLGVAPLFYKYANRMNARLSDWWKTRKAKEVVKEIDELSADKLLDNLPRYLGADLFEAQFGTETKSQKRVIAFVDTYEAFWWDKSIKNGPGALNADKWIRCLVEDSPGVLFVLLGRDKKDIERWLEEDKDWEQYIETHRLGALSTEDADFFLRGVPISDKDIRKAIIDSAEGLPFYLDLQVSLYESRKNKGEVVSPENFGGHGKVIVHRFMEHLDKNEQRALQILAHARFIDEEIYSLLTERFLGGRGVLSMAHIISYSFVESGENDSFSMHPLMREPLMELTQKEEPSFVAEIHECLFDYYDLLAKVEDIKTITSSHERALEEAAYHLSVCREVDLIDWCQERCEKYEKAGKTRLIHPILEKAIEISRRVLGDEHPDTLSVMNNLANTLNRLGEFDKSRQLQEQVLEIISRVLGDEHPDTLLVMSNLAVTLRDQGELDKARQIQEQVLEISRRELGDENPATLMAMNNLAVTLWAQGELDKARQIQEQVLEISRRVLGDEHPTALKYMSNLGLTLNDQGELDKSRQLQEQVLEIISRVLGNEHPNTLSVMNNLASTLWDQGELDQARQRVEQVLEMRRRVLGDEHPDTLSVMENLAIILKHQGELDKARQIQEQVLEISRRVLGDEHPITLKSVNFLNSIDAKLKV